MEIKAGSNYFIAFNGTVLLLTGKELKKALDEGRFVGGEEIYEGEKVGEVKRKTSFVVE